MLGFFIIFIYFVVDSSGGKNILKDGKSPVLGIKPSQNMNIRVDQSSQLCQVTYMDISSVSYPLS